MHNKGRPVILGKLVGNMPSHIMVYFREILENLSFDATVYAEPNVRTDTKKLVVPSARSNIPGNSFSQVSSPYMTSRPPVAFNWASHVSWYANVDEVSDSAMFRMTSKNDGTDPVVMAFNRGMVTVGELAYAVNGTAAPERIRLYLSQLGTDNVCPGKLHSPLRKLEPRVIRIDKIACIS